MAKGRPSAYNKTMLITADEYINGGYKDNGQVIPTAAGLAIHLDVAKSTIYKWCEDKSHPFSDMLAKCNETQEMKLINGGLEGTYNSTISKLILAKHDYSDKAEITGENGKDLFPSSISIKYD